MSARDELEALLEDAHKREVPALDAILEAGWRPPATQITTEAELDALPLGSGATRNRVVYTKDHKGWQIGGITHHYPAASLLLNGDCFLVYTPYQVCTGAGDCPAPVHVEGCFSTNPDYAPSTPADPWMLLVCETGNTNLGPSSEMTKPAYAAAGWVVVSEWESHAAVPSHSERSRLKAEVMAKQGWRPMPGVSLGVTLSTPVDKPVETPQTCQHCILPIHGTVHTTGRARGLQSCDPAETGLPYGYRAHPVDTPCPGHCLGAGKVARP